MQEPDRGITTPFHLDNDEYGSDGSPEDASYDQDLYTGASGPAEASTSGPPKTGKKRGRHKVSCAECRRLKLRCDRQVPCSNCVKRRCSDICPNGTRKRDARKKSITRGNDNLETNLLRTEKERLERLLDSHGIPHGQQAPPDARERPEFGVPRPYSPVPRQDDWGAHRLQTLASHASAISPRSLADRRENEVHSFPGLTPIKLPPFDSPFPPLQASPLQGVRPDLARPEGFWGRRDREERDVTRSTPPNGNLAHGTLVLGDSGRSRYLGPSAGTEWIRKSERVEGSRASSPSIQGDDQPEPATNWPFGTHSAFYTTAELFAKLPGEAEGASLVNAYFRFFAWNHNPVPKIKVNQILRLAYSPPAQRCPMQQLALLYSIFAIGTLHSLEYQPNDPIAEEYRQLAQACLSKGDFLIQNTIPGVQALYNLAHFYSESEQGKSGDQAWPLWGIAMRLVQAMGVHRDGSRWNLPPEVVEERRMVFWESHTMDIFQSHCFSRPATMRPRHTDTQYPSETGEVMGTILESPFIGEYHKWKYELARIFEGALDHAMNVEPPAYSHVVDLYDQLCGFERSVPYHMRCRTALLATPSRCPDQAVAIAESPEVNRSDLKKTFEQFTLALNITEAILFLQRPYFARALQEEPMDAMKSKYGQSFLAVVERCNVTTQIVCGLVELFPRVAVRHWFYWYHLFNAAVCIGTLLIRSPHSPVAPYTLSVLDQAIGAYAIAAKEVGSPSLKRNHSWLVRLRQKGGDKVANLDPIQSVFPSPYSEEPVPEGEGDGGEELLAWRTRLVERAAKGIKRAISISTASGAPLSSPRNMMSLTTITAPPSVSLSTENNSNQSNSGPTGLDVYPLDLTKLPMSSFGTADAVMQQHFAQSPMQTPSVDPNNAMDLLLNQFWDPMLIPDSTGTSTGNRSQTGPGPYNSMNWWALDQSNQSGSMS